MSELKISLMPGLIGDSYVLRLHLLSIFALCFGWRMKTKPTFLFPFPAIDLCILISCLANRSYSVTTVDPWAVWGLGTIAIHEVENPLITCSWPSVSMDSIHCRSCGPFKSVPMGTRDQTPCSRSTNCTSQLTWWSVSCCNMESVNI